MMLKQDRKSLFRSEFLKLGLVRYKHQKHTICHSQRFWDSLEYSFYCIKGLVYVLHMVNICLLYDDRMEGIRKAGTILYHCKDLQ